MRTGAAILALCAAGTFAAHPAKAIAQSTGTQAKHYRLTFVVTYPQTPQATQNLVLDVPVKPDHPGMASLSMAAGSIGEVEGSSQQSLVCTDVRSSDKGLSAKIAFTMETVPPAKLPGVNEPIHSQLTFERQIDLALVKPTLITEKMTRRPLQAGDVVQLDKAPAPPEITVTAIEM